MKLSMHSGVIDTRVSVDAKVRQPTRAYPYTNGAISHAILQLVYQSELFIMSRDTFSCIFLVNLTVNVTGLRLLRAALSRFLRSGGQLIRRTLLIHVSRRVQARTKDKIDIIVYPLATCRSSRGLRRCPSPSAYDQHFCHGADKRFGNKSFSLLAVSRLILSGISP